MSSRKLSPYAIFNHRDCNLILRLQGDLGCLHDEPELVCLFLDGRNWVVVFEALVQLNA